MSAGLSYFLQQSINGISIGSIYALISIGYSMVYGLLYMINFAHGDLYVFGTFIVFSFLQILGPQVPAIVACVIGAIGAAILGILIERFAYRPVRAAHRNVPFISALGVAAVLKTIAQVIWGPETYAFDSLLPQDIWNVGGIMIYAKAVTVIGIAVACIIVVMLLLNCTKFGMASRFIQQDVATASLMGVNTNVIIPAIYALGGALGALGGVIYSSYYNMIGIEMGLIGTVKAWAVVTLAGPGSFVGCFVGGVLLGWVESMVGSYFTNSMREAFGYIFIVIVLMFKPYGLFGHKKTEKV